MAEANYRRPCELCGASFERTDGRWRRHCGDCRSAQYRKQHTVQCFCCGKKFLRLRKGQRACSDECASQHREDVRKRAKERARQRPRSRPSVRAPLSAVALAKRRAEKKKHKAMRRARKAIEAENIDPIKVFDRDRWRCHLCGCKTPRRLRGTNEPNAPELDHIVSLADGGSHTWGNVACACRACNGAKGARSAGQLGLGLAA